MAEGRATFRKGERVRCHREDDGDDRCPLLCCNDCCGSRRDSDIDLELDELGRDLGEAMRPSAQRSGYCVPSLSGKARYALSDRTVKSFGISIAVSNKSHIISTPRTSFPSGSIRA